MTKWQKTFKLKDLFDGDDSDEHAHAIAIVVAERLAKEKPFRIINNLERSFKGCYTLDSFNKVLNRLYDLADYEKVWIA